MRRREAQWTGGRAIVALLLVGSGVVSACGDDDTDGGTLRDGGVPLRDGESGSTAAGLDFEEITVDIATLTGFRFVPGTENELLALSHEGSAYHLRIDGDEAEELGRFTVPEVTQDGDCGLLSVAFDPDYASNQFVYFGHCGPAFDSRITRITFSGSNYAQAPASAQLILSVAPPATTAAPFNHNIGTIGFDPDGTLWTLIGDKGTDEGQDPNLLTAALIRIVPDRTPTGTGYTPAAGNAFTAGTGAPEIYALGLRYGWRAARDDLGRYWVGDVGGSQFEEVNLVAQAGENFGWRPCEGRCDPPDPAFTDPLLSWPHQDSDHPYFRDDPESEATTRRVVWVGQPYPTMGIDRYDGLLTDVIPFGDTCLGWVRAASADAAGQVVSDRALGHLAHITDWVPGPDGYVYASTFGSCDSRMVFEPAKLVRAIPRAEQR